MKHFSKKSRLKRKIWKRVADGIYRHRISRTLFERPMHFIKGKYRWTFRSLLTKNLKLAKEEYHRRKVSRATGPGNSPRIRISDAAEVIVGEVIQRYVDDGCPDRFRKERPIKTKQTEQHNCETLLEYWNRIPFSGLTLAACDRYHDWRCDRITRGTGDRTVDLELNTLSNALLWGCRKEIIPHNPLAVRRPRYCSDKNVHHCRESNASRPRETCCDLGSIRIALGKRTPERYVIGSHL